MEDWKLDQRYACTANVGMRVSGGEDGGGKVGGRNLVFGNLVSRQNGILTFAECFYKCGLIPPCWYVEGTDLCKACDLFEVSEQGRSSAGQWLSDFHD